MDVRNIAQGIFLFLVLQKSESIDSSGISGCRTTKLDLVFVVDASSSFRDGFNYVRDWIKNLTSHFDVSPYSTRISVVQSGDTPYTDFEFHVFDTTEEVLNAVDNIQFGLGISTTGDTLRYVKDHVLDKARKDASKVVLVLSDGEIRKHNDVRKASKVLHNMGVTTFAIGAGENISNTRNVAYLKTIASDPVEKHLFVVRSLDALNTAEKSILSELCKHTVQECPTSSHDLAFIIDSSSTISFREYRKIKDWMKRIVEAFDVGRDETRIAVIEYSTKVHEEISFKDNYTKSEVLRVIDDMPLMAGDTSTGQALDYSLNVVFADGNGGRSNIPDVAIVMTDGRAQDHGHVLTSSKAMHDAGIEVYVVGVADYSLEEVNDIASDPDENHVILATGFDQIDLQRIGLIKRICEESEPGCSLTAADIVFLVDNAVTFGQNNLQHTKAWIKSIVDSQEVGPHYTRIGLVRYADNPELVFGLSTYSSTSDVINAVTQKLRHVTGYSMTGRAINYVTSVVFNEARENVPKFLIILTEGYSDDDMRAALQTAKDSGIGVFSFGVGDINVPVLEEMASSPNQVFFDYSFEGIRRQHGKFMSALCEMSEPACEIQEIDLQFLVDGSSSILKSDFDKVKNWIRNVIRSFDIGTYTTRVGVTQYSSQIKNEFDMNTFKTKREIEHAVAQMQPIGGMSHTGYALGYVMRNSFNARAGSREGAEKVLVILTDGNTQDSIEGITKEVHEAGIRVFAIGAGDNTDRSYLEKMATEPIVSHVKEAASYDAINTMRKNLVGEICRETKSECPDAEMDLIFLVDGSSSIGEANFVTVKNWLVNFVQQFEIGEYNSKIGVIQYSNQPRMEINLTKFLDKESLIGAIQQMEYLTGEEHTGAALSFLTSKGFIGDTDAREKAPKVVIVLTDGASRDSVATPAQVLRDKGVYIYAVGVGDTDQSELRSIASSDDSVLHVRNYDAIQTLQSSLVRRVCNKVQIECRENATDIVMLIDGSNSVGYKDWEVVKSFMRNITERFHIGEDGVQVGVVQYSTDPQTEFTMKNHGDISALQDAIDRIEWMKGDTHTAQALRFVRKEALTKNAGARGSNVSKILIVVTDGDPQDSDEVEEAATAIHADGWRVFAIGVGQATIPELNVIASDPDQDHVFYADNYESTRKLKGRLFRMICTEYEIVLPKRKRNKNNHLFSEDFDVDEDGHVTGTGIPDDLVDVNSKFDGGNDGNKKLDDNGNNKNDDDEDSDIDGDLLDITDIPDDLIDGQSPFDEKNDRDNDSNQNGKDEDFDTDGNSDDNNNNQNDQDVTETFSVDEIDIYNSNLVALELKEPQIVNIDNSSVILFDGKIDPNFDGTVEGQINNPDGSPYDIVVLKHPPNLANQMVEKCPVITRKDQTIKGWDMLQEMDIKHHLSEPGHSKPKRSTILSRYSDGSDRYRAIKMKPGSSDIHTSYRLTSKLGLSRPLNRKISHFVQKTFSFVSIFRMQGVTAQMDWTLINITNQEEATVFAVSFTGHNQNMVIEILTTVGQQWLNVPSAAQLFDKEFHKLEILSKAGTVFIAIDCVVLQENFDFQPVYTDPKSFSTALITVSNSASKPVVVDVQDLFMKCESKLDQECCELPGQLCMDGPHTPVPFSKSLDKCVCPPGPPGPQGPPGNPGKVLKRGLRGKRGPPGKATCPPVTRNMVKTIARKLAQSMIDDKILSVYETILASLSDDGRINPSVIKMAMKSLKTTENEAFRGSHHQKYRPGQAPDAVDDCGDVPCDTIPSSILDNL